MGLLDGGAARFFGEILSPLYLRADLRRVTVSKGARGAVVRTATVLACRASVDRATERMVATEGYTDTDRAIYILATSLAGNVATDDEITLLEGPYSGTAFKLASPIDRDPAGAYWLARGMRGRAA